MAILAECPECHRKQSIKNRVCECSADLLKLKKAGKVRFWINYRLPGGKQRREAVGFSIEEAKDAEGKRRGQKRENRIFDMLPEAKITFSELAEWYIDRDSVKQLASYDRVKQTLASFNRVFGEWIVNTIKPNDLEKYQTKRAKEGLAPATIDMELSIAKTMVTRALDNDMVDGKTLKAFRCIKKKLKAGSNARTRTLTVHEYLHLLEVSPGHLKPILIVAYNTGMRRNELRELKWSHIDHAKKFIRLPSDMTKEGKSKNIPMNHHVIDVLRALPRTLGTQAVFTYKGRPYNDRSAFKRSFATACKNSDITVGRDNPNGFIFHDIRRTVKTNMLAAGVQKVYRDVILGHSLQGMDVHYLVPSENDLTNAMEQFTLWLDNQIKSAYTEIALTKC